MSDIERFHRVMDAIENQYLDYMKDLREVDSILVLYLINDIASIVSKYAEPCSSDRLFDIGTDGSRSIYMVNKWKLTLEYDERPYWNHDRLEIESDDDHIYRIDEILNELEYMFM
jgi:hypothetical protein